MRKETVTHKQINTRKSARFSADPLGNLGSFPQLPGGFFFGEIMREIKFRAWDFNKKLGYKQNGYQMRKAEWHPHCNKKGYVMEHRLIMESHIGDYLPKHAIIHHINHIRDDNRIENLGYMLGQERHAKEHDNGKRNPNGQFVAQSPEFVSKKFRLLNKNTGLMQIFTLQKLIATTFRKGQFEYRGTWTGLKDKNGQDIYEGDIVCLDGGAKPTNCEVIFEYGCFCIKAPWITDNQGYPELKYYIDIEFCETEIAGNIYENPELTKSES